MSIWSMIVTKLKEMMHKMIGARTIEQKLHVAPVISSQMEEAIQLWTDMYKNKAPWLKEPTFADPSRVVSLGLPSMIASEKARTALLEFKSEITTPTEEVEVDNPGYVQAQQASAEAGEQYFVTAQPPTIKEDRPVSSTARAEYLNKQYERLKEKLRTQAEYGIAKGGLVIKPYVVINKAKEGETEVKDTATIEFDFIQADAFYPLAFDASGNITEAAFLQTKTEKNTVYRRLEYHKWSGNTVEIMNSAYKSTNTQNQGDMSGIDLGIEVPLKEVSEWSALQPKTKIANVDKPLFAYFKMPQANIIDTSSPLGVSGFSRAVSLIKDADMQYSRLLWEYEGGELAIDIDRDAMSFREGTDGKSHTIPNHLQARLFRKVDLSVDGSTYEPFAPVLRDSSYLQGLNAILMRIEDAVALSRGTLSDSSAEARTATELKILKQRSYQENAEIQKALENALKDVIYIMDVYCDLYGITEKGEYDTSFEWDDSIITDVDTELNKRLTLMQNGITSKLEVRMWYFGETERQAQQALVGIEEENMKDMQNQMIQQANFEGNEE